MELCIIRLAQFAKRRINGQYQSSVTVTTDIAGSVR